jgi:hypothetical protein
VRALVLCLLLALGGLAGAQEAPPPAAATDKVAYALMQDTLLQAERWMLEMFIQPGKDVPVVVLQELEKLDAAVQASYFRDLAQRSGMLVFLTREEVRLVQERRRAPEISRNLLRESKEDRRRDRRRRTTATLFWASLGTAAVSFAGSYGCWYLSEHLDNLYLDASTPPEKIPLYRAWSKLLQGASYGAAGIGTVGITIALPALAGLRPR